MKKIKIIDAFSVIKEYCNSRDDCRKCIFYKDSCGCSIKDSRASDWVLPDNMNHTVFESIEELFKATKRQVVLDRSSKGYVSIYSENDDIVICFHCDNFDTELTLEESLYRLKFADDGKPFGKLAK